MLRLTAANSSMRILVTGAGIISAMGPGKSATLSSLKENRSGVTSVRYLETSLPDFPVGEVKLTNGEMASMVGWPEGKPVTRTALMGILALSEAVAQAGMTPAQLKESVFVNGTTVGGMDKSEEFYLDFISDRTDHTEYIPLHDCGATSRLISGHFGGFREVFTPSTACSSAANAVIFGANLLKAGKAETVVVGGCECLSDFHLCGFNTLMILDNNRCRPFDSTRNGLNLGEGAAYLVLETEESAARRGVSPLAELSGYGNACDAFHQTASSPDGEGAFLAMGKALAMAGLAPGDIDYVNAHGTGTRNNDESESAAMKRIFGENIPPVSSTKPLTGHTTSASGSIESVICLLAMQDGFIPGNCGWENADEACIAPVAVPYNAGLTHVLCNSFGFGGNDSSLLFSRPGVCRERKEVTCDGNIYVKAISFIGEDMTDPDFRTFLSPLEARRMGKLMKRAVAVSETALKKCHLERPDAIISGTWFGSVENTETLLLALKGVSGQPMKPTNFMQSTHNTVSSLIGIRTASHGYNCTYSDGKDSLRPALLDAEVLLRLGLAENVLVGLYDEMTPTFSKMLAKAGIRCPQTALAIVLDKNPEGAVCLVDEIGEHLKENALCGD